MEGEYEVVRDLSNGAISNDLERTLTLFSRLHHLCNHSALIIHHSITLSPQAQNLPFQ